MVDAGPEPTYEEKTRVPPPPGVLTLTKQRIASGVNWCRYIMPSRTYLT